MRLRTSLVAVLIVALPFTTQAAVPPSQDRYAVNLGIPPTVPAFVQGQVPFWIDTTNTSVNAFGLPKPVSDQSPFPVMLSGGTGSSTAVPAYTTDSNSAAFQGVVAITPGVPTAAQRSFGFICTASGPVTLTLADGSTITLGLSASTTFQSLPFAVTNVLPGSGTAGTFWNLK